jgi:hypothetical protein
MQQSAARRFETQLQKPLCMYVQQQYNSAANALQMRWALLKRHNNAANAISVTFKR